MSRILINGIKANLGGGKVILNNYLELLRKSNSRHKYFVLTPDRQEYLKYSSDSVEIIDTLGFFKKNAVFILLYFLIFPRLIKKYKIDAIFNFGAIIIPTKVSQLYLFDWAYVVYPESVAWKRVGVTEYLIRILKVFLIKKYIRRTKAVIAQTATIKKRLEEYCNLDNITVIPNAVPLEVLGGTEWRDFSLPGNKFKMLYPASYGPHKNMDILISLSRKIREKNLPYVIVMTINAARKGAGLNFLEQVKKEKLDSIILNVEYVNIKHVASLYKQSDALFMPSLIESYGLPYVEAMQHRKIIFTSDIDFARDACGDAAYYFDPMDVDSMLNTVDSALKDKDGMQRKIDCGKTRNRELLKMDQVFEKYQVLLENILSDANNN